MAVAPERERLARSADSGDQAWARALGTMEWVFSQAPALHPSPATIEQDAHRNARAQHAAAVAAGQMALRAFVAVQPRELDQWNRILERIASRNETVEVSLEYALAQGWSSILRGETVHMQEQLATLEHQGRDARFAHITTLFAIQRAFAALSARDIDGATTFSRRASRMARAESFLQCEYLANIALARSRRHAGRGYLALRILDALAQVTPVDWQRWLAFERGLCGAGSSNEAPAKTSFVALANAIERGSRIDCQHAGEALAVWAQGFHDLYEECAALLATIGVAPISVEADAWCRGRSDAIPFGIRDPCADTESFVIMDAGPSRRMLASGLRLLRAEQPIWTINSSKRQGTRNHRALAILAMAGDAGVTQEELFAGVYGFGFDAVRHGRLLRTLVFRIRAELGDVASLERDGTQLRLVAHRAIAIPDPRSALDLGEKILAEVASASGRSTAREVARAMKVPLRTVQATLHGLVDEHLCTTETDGRRVEYVVEDTTFREPSLLRLRGSLKPR